MNTGPRHCRKLGWAVSYTKNLSQDTRTTHDTDVIGATTLMWHIIRSVMPTEVTSDIEEQLSALDLPRMATRDVSQGAYPVSSGYFLYID